MKIKIITATLGDFSQKVKVRMYRTTRTMQIGYALHGDCDSEGVLGACSPCEVIDYRKGKSGAKRLDITVFLNEEDLGAGYLAHEMLHAAIAALHYHEGARDIYEDMDFQEALCYVLGDFVTQFWRWWHEEGMYE